MNTKRVRISTCSQTNIKMLYREIKNNNRKVQIFRQKSLIQKGYEYFLQVLTKGMFGDWVVNTNYKQKIEINSEQVAIRVANEFLDDGS
jgi:hypothetical protein